MTSPNPIDDLVKQLLSVLPKGLLEVQEDLEKNMRASLQAGLKKMNLVTREEFEVQQAVLLRTRQKLEALEKQVAELEQQTPP